MFLKLFVERYGYKGLTVAVSEFIARAPEFPGDVELAKVIGEMLGNLEVALREVNN